MFPDDKVLVGVINRAKDLKILREQLWYRIPQAQMPNGVITKYIAFFLSGNAAKQLGDSGIYYYAEKKGLELRYRKDLLPDETSQKAREKAEETYYQVQFNEIEGKVPPITNPTKRRFAFIHTTFDRFIHAKEIADLYSDNDYFVDRIYHALRNKTIQIDRYWDAQRTETGHGASLCIVCENGALTGYTDHDYTDEHGFLLATDQPKDKILAEIKARMAQMGGPISLPTNITY